MWHVFTELQKCSCPLQIVKSRDNSTADELDLHFLKCPEGLQFQNSRKLSRRNSDCIQQVAHTDSVDSWWVTKKSIAKYVIEIHLLKPQYFSQHQAEHRAKHKNQRARIQILCFTWKQDKSHIYTWRSWGGTTRRDNKQQLQDENTRKFWAHFWIKTFYTILTCGVSSWRISDDLLEYIRTPLAQDFNFQVAPFLHETSAVINLILLLSLFYRDTVSMMHLDLYIVSFIITAKI